uniref:60S ribosomal protein L18a n=1 Tax=Solanum lycopersicum TaxID=4081 RepID=K4CTD3_SOLLC
MCSSVLDFMFMFAPCIFLFNNYVFDIKSSSKRLLGRALPTETDEHPKIYRMKLWATNEVRAKSKLWCFFRKLKKGNSLMLAINEIFEKNPTTIKNYGIWLRYQSRTGYHNMYKEYRDTTLSGVWTKLCKRESTKQFHDSKIKFPLVFKKVSPPSRKLKTTYKATKTNLFM